MGKKDKSAKKEKPDKKGANKAKLKAAAKVRTSHPAPRCRQLQLSLNSTQGCGERTWKHVKITTRLRNMAAQRMSSCKNNEAVAAPR